VAALAAAAGWHGAPRPRRPASSDEREQTLNQLPAGTSPPDADARAAARCLPHCQNNLPAG
jgi:hypothetical protein